MLAPAVRVAVMAASMMVVIIPIMAVTVAVVPPPAPISVPAIADNQAEGGFIDAAAIDWRHIYPLFVNDDTLRVKPCLLLCYRLALVADFLPATVGLHTGDAVGFLALATDDDLLSIFAAIGLVAGAMIGRDRSGAGK